MSNKDIDFPQYRKLSNNKVYYRINNDRSFDEIQIIGQSAQLHLIEAIQYPEMLKIQDLLSLTDQGVERSSKETFDALLDNYSLR